MANALKLLTKTAEEMSWPPDIQTLMIAGYLLQTKPDLDQEKFTNATTDYGNASGLGTEYINSLLCKMVEDLEKVKDAKKWKEYLAEQVEAFKAEMKAQEPQLPFPAEETKPPSSIPQISPAASTTTPTSSAPIPGSPAPTVAAAPKFREINLSIPVEQTTYAKAAAILKAGKQLADGYLGKVIFQFKIASTEDPKIVVVIDVTNADPAVTIDPYMMDGTDFAASGKPGFDLSETFVFHYKNVEYKVRIIPT